MKWLFAVGTVLIATLVGCKPTQPTPPVTVSPSPTTTSDAPTQPTTPTVSSSTPTTPITASPLLSPSAPSATSAPQAAPTAQDYAAVKREIAATLKAQPKSFSLNMQAGEFFMRASDYPSAIAPLRKATQLQPKQVIPWIALGDAATLSGQFAQAEQAYSRAAVLAPDNPQLIRGKGQMLILQRKFEPARAYLEGGMKRHPQDVEIRTVLGNLYLVINKPKKVIEVVQPALHLQPERPDLHYMLGEAYARDLRVENAIREMQEAVRIEPTMVMAWGLLGLYQTNLTRYKEARPALERAIALNPKEAHYYWALGEAYVLDSSDPTYFDKGIELYRKSLQLDAGNLKALYSYGMALTRRGKREDLQQAVSLFLRLIKLKPGDTNAHFKLYESYRRLGRNAEAQAHRVKFRALFEKGRQQNYNNYASSAFVDTAEAHLKRAQQAMAKRDYHTAVQEFEFTLERDSNSVAAKQGLQQAKQLLQQSSGGAKP